MNDCLSRIPDFYPVSLDLANRCIHFIPMSQLRYRSESFLDHRLLREGVQTHIVSLDALLEQSRHVQQAQAVHYIVHGAFCCSTLLARYLERLPSIFVLKEPSLLSTIAALRPNNLWQPTNSAHANERDLWQELLALALKLLARNYTPENKIVIKTKVECNLIADKLLQYDPRSKLIYMHDSLRPFLLNILKSRQRRAWVKSLLEVFTESTRLPAGASRVNMQCVSDAVAAAYLWQLNSNIFENLRRRMEPARILRVDTNELVERSEGLIDGVSDFLGMRFSSPIVKPSGGFLIRRHAKNSSQEYDSGSRKEDISKAEAEYGFEADEGQQWVEDIGCRLWDFCAE